MDGLPAKLCLRHAASGCLAIPTIAQYEPGTLQLRFDPNPFDVAFEANGVALQIMFDLEHLADLHEQFVVREPVAHLVGGGAMGIGTENPRNRRRSAASCSIGTPCW